MQVLGIDDISVVGDGNRVVTLADDKGLYITDLTRTTGGIAVMANTWETSPMSPATCIRLPSATAIPALS
jgi:hypothetical protein